MQEYLAYCDGACRGGNPGIGSCAFVVYCDGIEVHTEKYFLGKDVTNNFCEYMGLIKLLEWAKNTNVREMKINCDSQLIVNQVSLVWVVKDHLVHLCVKAYGMLQDGRHSIRWVRGHDGNVGNERADQLCNEVLDENGVIPPHKLRKRKKCTPEITLG